MSRKSITVLMCHRKLLNLIPYFSIIILFELITTPLIGGGGCIRERCQTGLADRFG
jgi:hypothetical protein